MSKDTIKQQQDNLAQGRYHLLLRWRERWTLLIYALGVATTLFLVSAILLFVNKSWLPGALLTVASILTGATVRWLLERRNEAASEEDRAFQQQRNDLKDQADREKGKESRTALFGRKNIEKD
jgi:hypothetical protein